MFLLDCHELQPEDLAMLDFQKGMKPLVVYGLKHSPVDHHKQRCFIIFNCIMPGALVPMKQHSIYVVQKYDPAGYELVGHWERRARDYGDELYRLAHALQRTEGLSWLYILRTGFIAKGGEKMEACALQIIPKMRQALEDVCGEIQFEEVPERELWIPSLKAVDQAESVGGLLPI
jgi:hypothetical protein